MKKNSVIYVLGGLVFLITLGVLGLFFSDPGINLTAQQNASPAQSLVITSDLQDALSHTQPETLANPAMAGVTAHLTALQEQLDSLSKNQSALMQRVLALSQDLPHEDHVDESEPPEVSEAVDKEIEQTQISYFTHRYQSEHVDNDWYFWAESEIESQLEHGLNAHFLTDVTLMNTQCRSTLCKVEVGFDNQPARDAGFGAIALLMPWEGEAFYHVDPADPLTVVFYMAREGESLSQDE